MTQSSTKTLIVAAAITLRAAAAAAQSPGETSVATPTGHELSFSIGHYNYVEPGNLQISIHGAKFGGEYNGTLSLGARRRWFASANVRGNAGSTTYDGWCLPWLIQPSSSSPNGYALDLGPASTCSETGDPDGYVEVRGLVGKDLFPGKWGIAPATGIGVRYLSNGVTGVSGYRTDTYLYLPLRLTARMIVGRRVLGLNAEFDPLLRGWQHTHQSKLGGGEIPATPTTPAFTIDSFTDVSFEQHGGWAVRAGANYALTRHWSVEPSYIHWNVGATSANDITVAYTVNDITATQQLGAYEPDNTTDEFAVKVGFRWR